MKIGFLIPYFWPFLGGAESNCYYLAKELIKKGHEIHIFTSDRKDGKILPLREEYKGIKIHRFKETFKKGYYFRFYPSIKQILKQEFDILHVHGFGFIQQDKVIRKYKKKHPRTKLICTPHGPFMALKNYNFLFKSIKKLYLPKVIRAIKLYDKIIQVNPSQYIWMEKEYKISKEKIVLIPNGIPEENIANRFPKKDKIITYLGRVQKYKGLDQIIEVLPEGWKFIIMGDDSEDGNRLRKLFKGKNVEILGKVSEKEKWGWLDKSSIFAFPSEWEAFGISMLEAMARGNAIISTRTEGGKFLIKEPKNGFLFEFGNKEELKRKLEKLTKDCLLIKKMGKNNIKKAKKFTWEKIARDLEKAYKKLNNKIKNDGKPK